jgi:phage gp36-like protein
VSYALVADLVARFGQREMIQLTDRSTPPADVVDPAVAQPALDAASAIMDGFISVKYALPLTATSPLLVEICADVARFRLYADQAPEIVQKRNDSAMGMLRQIAQGVMKIDAASQEPPPRADVIETSGPERRTTRDQLRRF